MVSLPSLPIILPPDSPAVQLIDLLRQVLRVVGDSLVLVLDDIVECSIEDSDDLGTFIVDNSLGLGIPDDGNGVSSIIVWLSFEVQILEAFDVVERFFGRSPHWNATLGLAVSFVVFAFTQGSEGCTAEAVSISLPENVHPFVLMCGCTTDTAKLVRQPAAQEANEARRTQNLF